MKKNRKSNTVAQTATELAVFSAVFLFVVGSIVKQSVATSYYQNQAYRAMRMALSMSYSNAEGMTGGNAGGHAGNSSHNSASIFLVEDRLSVRSAKHAATDRAPHMIMGSGTYSRNLAMEINTQYPEEWIIQMPIVDIFVNGQHFPLTVAALRRVCLGNDTAEYNCGIDGLGQRDENGTTIDYHYDSSVMGELIYYNETGSDWTDWCAYNGDDHDVQIDCSTLYGQVLNSAIESNFCHPSPPGEGSCYLECAPIGNSTSPTYPFWGPAGGTGSCNMSWEDKYDLDRNPLTNDRPPSNIIDSFMWQWHMYRAFDDSISSHTHPTPGVPGISKGDMIDFDRDGKAETIINIHAMPEVCPFASFSCDEGKAGLVVAVDVLDNQEGDVDFSITGTDGVPKPGFDRDVQMFTQVRNGDGDMTVYLVEQGDLFSTGGQFFRSTQRKDQVDWIQRRFQLTNNTGRFCEVSAGTGPPASLVRPSHIADMSGPPRTTVTLPENPVEVCCAGVRGGVDCIGTGAGGTNCFSPQNILRTCMEVGDPESPSNPIYPELFIRSRLINKQGRKWVTEVTSDDYINFRN